MARAFIILGIVFLSIGLAWPWLGKLPLGRLPGDIVVERESFRLYLPITSGLLVSLIISLVLWLFRK